MMDFGNLSEIACVSAANLSAVTHVSESPPSSPSLKLYSNSSGSTFDFPDTQYSDYRDTQAEVNKI